MYSNIYRHIPISTVVYITITLTDGGFKAIDDISYSVFYFVTARRQSNMRPLDLPSTCCGCVPCSNTETEYVLYHVTQTQWIMHSTDPIKPECGYFSLKKCSIYLETYFWLNSGYANLFSPSSVSSGSESLPIESSDSSSSESKQNCMWITKQPPN